MEGMQHVVRALVAATAERHKLEAVLRKCESALRAGGLGIPQTKRLEELKVVSTHSRRQISSQQ